MKKYTFENREISWLSFNARVLQEAARADVPLLERLAFLAIYSSNLDEFFRVRVASMRSLIRLKKKRVKRLDFNPARLVRQINQIVSEQQESFGAIFRNQILPALQDEGIYVIDDRNVEEGRRRFLEQFFTDRISDHLRPFPLEEDGEPIFIKNRTLYLVTELWENGAEEPGYQMVELPIPPLPRFVELPPDDDRRYVMFLDDVIRYNIGRLYPDVDTGNTYAFKLSRDAELYLEDEFSGDLVQMIRKSLKKRDTGVPCRFLYDLNTPFALAELLKKRLDLNNSDMAPGGRYHNLSDLFGFPDFGKDHLRYEAMPPLPHPALTETAGILDAVAAGDRLMHFPYQSYDPVVRFFEEAAEDERVEEIWVSLYRVASDSAIARALSMAQERGKRVTAFVEVKARFDEASNLFWAEMMEKSGVGVLYSMPGLKVHAKIALVIRKEGSERKRYAYLGTGNFNEKTARIYADATLMTADERLTEEVQRVFSYLTGDLPEPEFEHLLVAPFTLRKTLCRLIDEEIEQARAGNEASILLKMNSLEDEKMIRRLYKASNAGVKIRIVVRGICRLVPGVKGQSENIYVTSIVDRYLEHARVFRFHNGGSPKVYLASADWMTRNLSHRVEVAFPVYEEALRDEIEHMMRLQLADNAHARIIDAKQANQYVKDDEVLVRSQYAIYDWLKSRLSK